MNLLIFTSALLTATMGQRGFYAGTEPKGYPELHSRFQNTEVNGSAMSGPTNVQVDNRLGNPDQDPTANPNIPTDARGDVKLVNRLNTWPRENQPFWLLNAQQIERHRHPNQQNQNRQQSEISQNNQQNFQPRINSNNENTELRFDSPHNQSGQSVQFQSRFGGTENTAVRNQGGYYGGNVR